MTYKTRALVKSVELDNDDNVRLKLKNLWFPGDWITLSVLGDIAGICVGNTVEIEIIVEVDEIICEGGIRGHNET